MRRRVFKPGAVAAIFFAALSGAVFAGDGRAQQVAEGFASTTDPRPPGLQLSTQTSRGRVDFDGTTLSLTDSIGAISTLLTFPSPVIGSFAVEARGEGLLLFGERTFGQIFVMSLPGNTFAPVPFVHSTIPNNFHATYFDVNGRSIAHVGRNYTFLVAAKTRFRSPIETEIFHVDARIGRNVAIARFPGDPGPASSIATSNYDDFVYATRSELPTAPPGSTSLLYFKLVQVRRAIFQPSLTLFAQDAHWSVHGLDAMTSIAMDSEERVYGIDEATGRVLRVDRFAGGPTLVSDHPGARSVQFFGGASDVSTFAAFQPEGTGRLEVFESPSMGNAQLRTIRPRRATLSLPSLPAPVGTTSVGIDGAPSMSHGLLFFGPAQILGEGRYRAGLLEPLFHHPTLPALGFGVPITTDALGRAHLALTNPGIAMSPGGSLAISAQGFVFDTATGFYVSTPPGTFSAR